MAAPEWWGHGRLPAWRADADGALGLHCAHGPKGYLLILAVRDGSDGCERLGRDGRRSGALARRRHGREARLLAGVLRDSRRDHYSAQDLYRELEGTTAKLTLRCTTAMGGRRWLAVSNGDGDAGETKTERDRES